MTDEQEIEERIYKGAKDGDPIFALAYAGIQIAAALNSMSAEVGTISASIDWLKDALPGNQQ